MGSASFLIIFALVNLANFVKAQEIGSSKLIALLGVVACGFALAALIVHTAQQNPAQLWILFGLIALAFAIEGIYVLFLREEGRTKRILATR